MGIGEFPQQAENRFRGSTIRLWMVAGHESSKITMDIYVKVKYNRPERLAGEARSWWTVVKGESILQNYSVKQYIFTW